MGRNKQITHKKNSFWHGVVVGLITAGVGMYFFGTKKGRKALKDIITAIEDLDISVEDILNDIMDKIEEKEDKKTASAKKGSSESLSTVLDKIKSSIPAKSAKKYFVKDGKVVK